MERIPLAIAKKVGCTPSMIQKINEGKQPSLKLAIKIAEAMDSGGPRLAEMIPLLKKAFSIMIRQGVG